MNVSTLLEHGHKISHLAAMTDEELVYHLDQLHKFSSTSTICAAYIHDLTTAMVGFNERAFTEVFLSANAKLGFFDCMMNVFYPFLRKAGLLWRTDKSVPIQEHFATCIIRNKIITATEALPPVAPDAAKYMLFLPPNEWHEVALLFANYIIRSKGYSTIYLGQNVPYEDLYIAIGAANPKFIFTFFITPKPVEEIRLEINQLGTNFPDSQILISGDGTLLNQISFTTDTVNYLKNVDELLEIL
jgi:methanogenic corrinoid protein MtbC1